MTTKRNDADQLRALQALGCLSQLLLVARAQMDVISWQKFGGLEAMNFVDALERGLPHPLLSLWERTKSGQNRPGPGLRERQFRRWGLWLSTALQDAGLGKTQARRRTAKALTQVFRPTSHRAVKHWELGAPPLDAAEQGVIETALARCGGDPEALVRHFTGMVSTIQLGGDSREGGSVLGNQVMPENER